MKINFTNTKTYEISQTETICKGSTHIGYVFPEIAGVSSYLSANLQDNAPTILRKPTTGSFNVSFFNGNGEPWVDNNAVALAPYLLVLYFKKI
jgi:hypothetical protein